MPMSKSRFRRSSWRRSRSLRPPATTTTSASATTQARSTSTTISSRSPCRRPTTSSQSGTGARSTSRATAGRAWKKADSGTQKLIYDVSMADDQVGWAVGQLGLILRTEDGGDTWKAQANSKQAEGVNLLSVGRARRQPRVGGRRLGHPPLHGGRRQDLDRPLAHHRRDASAVRVALACPTRTACARARRCSRTSASPTSRAFRATGSRCWMIGEFGYIFRTDNGGVNADGTPSWEKGEIVGGLSSTRSSWATT